MKTSEHELPPWTELEPYFDRALQLDPQECESWLAQLSTTRAEVAQAVRRLLAERESLNASRFLEGAAFAGAEGFAPALREMAARRAARPTGSGSPATARIPGLAPDAFIGPYRLIREIGYGGMSSVWLAQRRDGQLKREVALKLPMIGLRMQVELFMRERDLLAALTHPNIARLYDAGVSDSGQPYLAMEYVAGTDLLHSCDERQLTIRERLRLFVQVMQAMQFAHAELIIHRDLKPSNIMVTPEGRVVLLDFGIGKLLVEGDAQETHLTQMSGYPFTPGYASPEQVAGKPLTTASDIYSLGIILYELLTGVRPYRGYSSRAALEEAILKEDLKRPSQAGISTQAAAARGSSVRALARTLTGDLDTIVLKSLKKSPLERYPSVTAFAQDILNHLNSLPVSARPDSLWYRVGRFTARYKVPVAAASVAIAALLSGATVAVWQAREAAAERDRAVAFASRHQAVTEFLGRVITDAAASATPITVTELLTRSEKLALNNTSDSPENRAAVLEMIAERYQYSENVDRATQLLKSALALLQNSSDQALRSRLTCRLATVTAEMGTTAVAVQTIANEVDKLADDPRTASQCLLEVARLENAELQATAALRDAELGLERIRAAGPGSESIEGALLGAAAYAHHLSNRDAVAERYFAQALQKYRDIGQERSDGALTVISDWGTAIASAGMPRRAVSLFEQAERIEMEREAGAEPSTSTVGNRGLSLLSLGRVDAARAALERECQLAIKYKDHISEAHCLLGLARLSLQISALDAAAQYLDRAMQAAGPDAPTGGPFMGLMNVLHGRLDLAQGRTADAGARFDLVLANRSPSPSTVGGFLGKAEVELIEGNSARAVEYARQALQTATKLQGDLPYSNYTGLASLMLGRALQQLGDPIQARKSLDVAVAHLSNTVDADHPALEQARQLL
jgi:eukaryotic-like serine/threonine-protein kinase